MDHKWILTSYPWLSYKCLGVDLNELLLKMETKKNIIENILKEEAFPETELFLLLDEKSRNIKNIKHRSEFLEKQHNLTSAEKDKIGYEYLVAVAEIGLWTKLFKNIIDLLKDKLTDYHSLLQETLHLQASRRSIEHHLESNYPLYTWGGNNL